MSGIAELRRRYPWPDERPDVPEDWCGWCGGSNQERFAELLSNKTSVVVELGSFCGLSANILAETAVNATIICVDHFKGSIEHTRNEAWAARLPRLHETFLRNLWPHRARVIPLRATTLDGMREIYELGIVPNLIYVDAAHDEESVSQDVSLAMELFPVSELIGDDWLHPSVRRGVVAATHKAQFVEAHHESWYVPVEGRRP